MLQCLKKNCTLYISVILIILVFSIVASIAYSSVLFTAVNCGTPPIVQNATAHFNNTTFSHQAVYICDDDHKFYGADSYKTSECSAIGTWTDTHTIECHGKKNTKIFDLNFGNFATARPNFSNNQLKSVVIFSL